MSAKLEEMLRIARAAATNKLPPMHSEAYAQFENTFNPRTAEALVKGMQVLADIRAALTNKETTDAN